MTKRVLEQEVVAVFVCLSDPRVLRLLDASYLACHAFEAHQLVWSRGNPFARTRLASHRAVLFQAWLEFGIRPGTGKLGHHLCEITLPGFDKFNAIQTLNLNLTPTPIPTHT